MEKRRCATAFYKELSSYQEQALDDLWTGHDTGRACQKINLLWAGLNRNGSLSNIDHSVIYS